MQAQTLRFSLHSQLKHKSSDSPTYRKALTIYESILDSTRDIPHFQRDYANNDANFALFVAGSVFKLLLKDQSGMKFSVDAMLLVINLTLPLVNVTVVRSSGILVQLQAKVFHLIRNFQGDDRTPLMIRLAVSILSYTLINTSTLNNNRQAEQILCAMFDYAVESHRTNILSKQSSRMLTHLVKDNPAVAKVLSRHANMSMLSNLDNNLYLNNAREIIAEFPLQLVNDIGYRVCKHLSAVECSSEDEQTYLAQTYYFLEKLAHKFSVSTLEEICKELVGNMPASAQSDSKAVFCYIQALHAIFSTFVTMNEKSANRYLSAVISILQEYITKGGKVQKISSGILRSILSSCIRRSLWLTGNNDETDFFETMGLDQNAGNNFVKVVSMLEGMLSDEYPNYKATALVLSAFFDSVDKSAAEGVIGLVDKVVNFRDKFDDRSFKKVMHSIFRALSIGQLCQVYKIGVDGNIADEDYQTRNNLWLVSCTQKYDGQQQFHTYMNYYYPLLMQLKQTAATPGLPSIRIEAYKSMIEMMWRCLKVFCRAPDVNYQYETIIEAIKNEITTANDSTLDHIAMALEALCAGLYKQEYECKWAGNLISLLAKNLALEKNNSKQILRAIKYLSAIADKEYLNKVFDKNIVKLIQQKQKKTLDKPENLSSNLKNLQILIAVSNGINFYDPSVVAPYRVSREELVVKLIGELISENTLFQKKAYKYIFETLNVMGDSYLNEVVDLLQAYEHKINVASKHYRLAILTHLWKKLSQSEDEEKINQAFEFMKKYLPEVLLDMRDSNQRARKQAINLFESFCEKIIQMGLMENFVEIMCAGLAVDTVETKVSTLEGLAQIYIKKYDLSMEFSLGVLEIVLMLLYEQKSEIYKAIVDFSRRFVFSFEKSRQIPQVLSTILEQLFKADLNSKMQNRSILKHFLLKLTKRFGREQVQKFIPAEDRKILSNAIKIENRERKKKREKQIQRRLEAEKARNQRQASEDDEQYDERQEQAGQEDGEMENENNQQDELKQLDNTDNLLLKYDLDKENFHFEEDKLQVKSLKKELSNQKSKEDDITFQNGLMVVRDDPRRGRQTAMQDEDKQHEELVDARTFLNVKKKRKLNDIHEIKESGATFRSNRAGGDVRLKDKPQPYAFIQFNSKALNKRFKKRAEKAFDTVFERHEGGLKGLKSKIAGKRR